MRHIHIPLLLIATLAVAGGEEAQKPAAEPAFLTRAIDWLAEAQHESGGWGAGSHQKQQIRDPKAVQTDPATTAFTAMALIRAGHTPVRGRYKEIVRRATVYLVAVVEKAPAAGPRITDLKQTQPQSKMGPLVDTPMTVQLLARVLREIPRLRANLETFPPLRSSREARSSRSTSRCSTPEEEHDSM